jgi:hypothetical protein
VLSVEFPAEIECPCCGGSEAGCEHCDHGFYRVTECPSRYIGKELIQDIRIVTSTEQHLPVVGGLLDQSAWWFELKTLLKSEENVIENEKAKRR